MTRVLITVPRKSYLVSLITKAEIQNDHCAYVRKRITYGSKSMNETSLCHELSNVTARDIGNQRVHPWNRQGNLFCIEHHHYKDRRPDQ